MSLNDRIRAALDAGVDPDVFERCAVTLMRNHYDNVVAVEGGSDGGRDADIYEPVDGDSESRGRILVTTGDLLDNLKSSHATWKRLRESGEEFRVDQLVMVTTRSVSDKKRRNVLDYCRGHDLPAAQFWTRDWLVDALRRDADLRVELTGVRGRLEAITTRPVGDPPAGDLVGRTEDLRRLADAIDSGDVCLVGLPGVGKSRVLAQLAGKVHYYDRLARTFLIDDLVAIAPAVVVVDDAHRDPDALDELVRVRAAEQLPFRIVASVWPGAEDHVRACLSGASTVELKRLARADLDSLVRGLGVEGIRARAAVLDQADGRPGWAIVLTLLIVEGDGAGLIEGDFLLDQVASLTRTISESAALSDALACIAALGHATLEDLEVVADLVRTSPADLIAWLESAAQGGMLQRSDDRWTVFEPLQPLIVAASFFGRRRIRRWATLEAAFAGDQRLVRSLLEVLDRTATSGEARQLADAWFDKASAGPADETMMSLFALYGSLDERAADRAASTARSILRTPRQLSTSAGGRPLDPIGEAARAVLRAAFTHTCSPQATHGLLDAAIDDHRARHNTPDHPMRVVQTMVQHLDPDHGPLTGLRERVWRTAIDWFDQHPTDQRWDVLAEVARYVFDPQVEGTWTDPGNDLSFTVARGLAPADDLRHLVTAWSDIDTRALDAATDTLTHAAVADLCTVFEAWSSLAAGHPTNGSTAPDEYRAGASEAATRIQQTLKRLSPRFPGVPLRVNRQIDLIAFWNQGRGSFERLPVRDVRLARLVGRRDLLDDDIDGWRAERREEQGSLAHDLADLGAADGITELERLLRETVVLDGVHGAEAIAHTLAGTVDDPDEWLAVTVEKRMAALVPSMLAACRGLGIDVTAATSEALSDPVLRRGVIAVFVRETAELDDLARSVVAALGDTDSEALQDLWILDEVTPMLRTLLTHPTVAIRSHAALAFGVGTGHGPRLTDDLRVEWAAGLVAADPILLTGHSRWRLEKMLEQAVTSDPVVCADWLIARAASSKPTRTLLRGSGRITDIVRELPREQKRRICRTLSNDALASSDFAAALLASDEDLTSELVATGQVDNATLLAVMSGARDDTVAVIGAVLVRNGATPREVARRAVRSRSWVGSESSAIEGDIAFFAELAARKPGLAEVCSEATQMLSRDREAALEVEEAERIRGRY